MISSWHMGSWVKWAQTVYFSRTRAWSKRGITMPSSLKSSGPTSSQVRRGCQPCCSGKNPSRFLDLLPKITEWSRQLRTAKWAQILSWYRVRDQFRSRIYLGILSIFWNKRAPRASTVNKSFTVSSPAATTSWVRKTCRKGKAVMSLAAVSLSTQAPFLTSSKMHRHWRSRRASAQRATTSEAPTIC